MDSRRRLLVTKVMQPITTIPICWYQLEPIVVVITIVSFECLPSIVVVSVILL